MHRNARKYSMLGKNFPGGCIFSAGANASAFEMVAGGYVWDDAVWKGLGVRSWRWFSESVLSPDPRSLRALSSYRLRLVPIINQLWRFNLSKWILPSYFLQSFSNCGIVLVILVGSSVNAATRMYSATNRTFISTAENETSKVRTLISLVFPFSNQSLSLLLLWHNYVIVPSLLIFRPAAARKHVLEWAIYVHIERKKRKEYMIFRNRFEFMSASHQTNSIVLISWPSIVITSA